MKGKLRRDVLIIAVMGMFGSACAKQPEEAKPVASEKAVEAAPPRVNRDILPWNEARCDKVLSQVKAEVVKHRSCKVDEDCVGVQLGCPFGCPAVLNKAAPVEELKTSLIGYHKNCACREPCEAGKRVFFCREGRCEMRVEKIESK